MSAPRNRTPVATPLRAVTETRNDRPRPASAGNLPLELSSFVGREHEISEIVGILGTPGC
jgi:hypothetical protein